MTTSHQIFQNSLKSSNLFIETDHNPLIDLRSGFLQSSSLHRRVSRQRESFARICEASQLNVGGDVSGEVHFNDLTQMQNDFFYFPMEDNNYNILSLVRGNSQCFQDTQQKTTLYKHNDSVKPTTSQNVSGHAPDHQEGVHLVEFLGLPSNQIGQDLISHYNISPTTSDLKAKSQGQPRVKTETKNVTKNIGKLLFKFIWKNRNNMHHKLKIDLIQWESFIAHIRQWKRQNNITREYLTCRWNGNSNESKIFRIISHYFFRKHCLAAVLNSRIELKRIHFERIRKFDQAILDPKALQYLS